MPAYRITGTFPGIPLITGLPSISMITSRNPLPKRKLMLVCAINPIFLWACLPATVYSPNTKAAPIISPIPKAVLPS